MSDPSPRIIDAPKGPLIGDGRLRRMVPFATTATVSLIVAVPATSWIRPGSAVAGSVLIAATIVGSLLVPWHRLARSAQVAPPLLFLVAMLWLASASGGGVGSPFITIAVLPMVWLAIYEHRSAVLLAVMISGLALWFAVPGGQGEPSSRGGVALVVFVVCGAGMGVTLQGHVTDARRSAFGSRDHQLAVGPEGTMLNALPEPVIRYRLADLVVTYCNTAWATAYHLEPSQVVGRTLDQFLNEDGLAGLHSQLALLGPDNPVLTDCVARSDFSAPGQRVEWVDRYLNGVDGPEVLAVGRDVTDRFDAELELADSEARFRDLADKSADVVWRFLIEPTPHFDYMSPSVENILGYPASYFLEDFARMLAILDDAGTTAIDRAIDGEEMPAHFDFHFRHANGSIVVGETRTTVVPGGLQGVSRDVTELRRLQDITAALAVHDPLTGLANRRLLIELLDADLARTERRGHTLAVAFLDLDDFKIVNDTYGHDVGDLVLCETARRLLAVVRGADTVARIGGDEFVIVYEPNDANSHDLIQRVDQSLSEPIDISPTIAVSCPASIGIADTRAVGHNSGALLAAADKAMYDAKRARQAVRHAQRRLHRTTAGPRP